jgi:hypothetical protein
MLGLGAIALNPAMIGYFYSTYPPQNRLEGFCWRWYFYSLQKSGAFLTRAGILVTTG